MYFQIQLVVVLNKEIQIHDISGAYGAARAAGCNGNDFKSFSENVSQHDYIKTFVPNDNNDEYLEAYESWKDKLNKMIK